jgi:pimeloyl-ACP methyl ester carboxylesterase
MNESRSGFADVGGARLFYESHGAGPPLLFLHGFTFDRTMWRRQVEALSDRFEVIVYDARGFGRSDLPTTETYLHCDDAEALCRALSLDRVIAVGHSIGAHQMLELALKHPSRVVGWVAIGMSGLASVPFSDDLMSVFADVRRAAAESIEAAKQIWVNHGWFAPAREVPELAVELDRMLESYSGWHWTHTNPAGNIEPPASDQLESLRVPALVVTGGRDLPYNHANSKILRSKLSNVTALDLPLAGHMPNMEDPEPVNRAISELAQKVFG